MSSPLFVELCAGTGVLSASFRRRGWRTVTVDVDASHAPDVLGDLRLLRASDITRERPTFLWMAPPCTEFSRRFLPWLRGKFPDPPDMSIVSACLRIRDELAPRWWALENVKGSVPWLSGLLGPPVTSAGGRAFYLWGSFPALGVLPPCCGKEGLSSSARVARASYPVEVCEAVASAVDAAVRGGSPRGRSVARGAVPLASPAGRFRRLASGGARG